MIDCQINPNEIDNEYFLRFPEDFNEILRNPIKKTITCNIITFTFIIRTIKTIISAIGLRKFKIINKNMIDAIR